jgi:Flp pilus assembly protein TadD
VVRLEGENFEAHLDLGICYAQKGFYAEAERAYEKARALNAEDLLLNYNLAALYALWDRAGDALTFLQKALGIDRQKVLSWLQADPMFDSLKSKPEFESLL